MVYTTTGMPSRFSLLRQNAFQDLFVAAMAEKWPDKKKSMPMKKVWLTATKRQRILDDSGGWYGEIYGHEPTPPKDSAAW